MSFIISVTHHYLRKLHSIFFCLGGGGRVLWISSDRDGDDQSIFGGLKFSIPGFFWVRKFGKYFFVWLALSGDLISNFWGY